MVTVAIERSAATVIGVIIGDLPHLIGTPIHLGNNTLRARKTRKASGSITIANWLDGSKRTGRNKIGKEAAYPARTQRSRLLTP